MILVERLLGMLVRLAAGLGVASLLALMVLTVVTVVFRAIGIAFPGTYVLAELLLIPTVSFGLAYAAWDGAHTKVELLIQMFRPRLAQMSAGITLLLGTGFWGFVAWAGIEEALRRGRQGEKTPLLDISVAPFRWIMVAAICLLIAICVFRALQLITGKEARE
ncbi:TRAP transporter small permease [Citreimonas salinaria]|uniref:TRAP transporter small permease protein n=1 Tax=Citreimonas salinaria TaxID=321339 RepID=A0A1H3L9N0_9RHOB|nr:TRAP transporter small permease subunit [Citreimonas salinaria]SDY61132.1 TRAP-type C4-dicarboxylate transport system, small permease component [Citreimonas salinaria]